MSKLPKDKKDRLYIMLDKKSENVALVKAGITSDTLKNRFHCYRTSNPLLELVSTCEIRKNQDLKNIELMAFDYFRNVKGYEHVFGEWVLIDNAEDIQAIETMGFMFFENLKHRIKKHELYNTAVYQLWECNKR